MEPQKYKNGQMSVGHFCGKRAIGANKTEKAQKVFVVCVFLCLWSVRDIRHCSRFSKHCTKPAFEDEIDVKSIAVVVVVVFFTLTDRASTIPNNTRGCQSGTWSAGQKKIRGTSTKLQ